MVSDLVSCLSFHKVWKHFVEEAEVEVVEQDAGALKTQYLDVIISDVRTAPQFGFSVQVLNNEGMGCCVALLFAGA